VQIVSLQTHVGKQQFGCRVFLIDSKLTGEWEKGSNNQSLYNPISLTQYNCGILLKNTHNFQRCCENGEAEDCQKKESAFVKKECFSFSENLNHHDI
jgi:hypothetical protein